MARRLCIQKSALYTKVGLGYSRRGLMAVGEAPGLLIAVLDPPKSG